MVESKSVVAQIERRIGNSEMNFRFGISDHRTERREPKKNGEKKKKIGEPDFYRSVMVERKLKGEWERERWRCEAEKRKWEKKRVWERGDGAAEMEGLKVKDDIF